MLLQYNENAILSTAIRRVLDSPSAASVSDGEMAKRVVGNEIKVKEFQHDEYFC